MLQTTSLDAFEQLALLNFAVRLLLSERKRDLLIERALEALSDFSGASRLGVFLLQDDASLKPAGYWISGFKISPDRSVSIPGSPFERVVRDKKTMYFPLGAEAEEPVPVFENGVPGRTCLVSPLVEAGARVIGATTLEYESGFALEENRRQSIFMLLSVFAISLENIRFLEELRAAGEELEKLNSAKTKMIDHLSHELRTPLAVIAGAVKLLTKASVRSDQEKFQSVLDRINRNLDRLKELEEEAEDIASGRPFLEQTLIIKTLQRTRDLMQTLAPDDEIKVSELTGLMDQMFDPADDQECESIDLSSWIAETIIDISSELQKREINLKFDLTPGGRAVIPESVLFKSFRGVVRNAVESTPDGQSILISTRLNGQVTVLEIHDFGVGLDETLQKELFHGFVHAGSTGDYSTGAPWDFGAGGRGLDLLRIKIFSEKYGFHFFCSSRPCPYAADPGCPGRVDKCNMVSGAEECSLAGETVFCFEFPADDR